MVLGLDTAYIPVAEEDIKYFVEDVCNNPDLVEQRVNQLTPSKQERKFLTHTLYKNLLAQTENDTFDSHFGFTSCCILAYLSPYYYDRGQSLGRLADDFGGEQSEHLFSLLNCFQTFFSTVPHCGDSGGPNYCSGYYISKENITPLHDALMQLDRAVGPLFEEDSGLIKALKYAQKHQTGLLEAFDIQVPFSGDFFTSRFNLRAWYLDNLDDERIEKECIDTSFTIGFPVPSSSIIDMFDTGPFIFDWVRSENLLPIFENDPDPKKERAVSGQVEIRLIFEETTPLVVVRTTQNTLLHDPENYAEKIRLSFEKYLTQNGLEANFFISLHDSESIPKEIKSSSDIEVRYFSKPSFIFSRHQWLFTLDDEKLAMEFGYSGRMVLSLNGEKIDEYRLSDKDIHRTVYFAGGHWYTISVDATQYRNGDLDLKIYKGVQPKAAFKCFKGAEQYPLSKNLVLMAGEMATIFLTLMTLAARKPILIPPLLLIGFLMFKYNQRHHYFLKPSYELEEDSQP
ncbi:hypothetical protein HB763_13485 [Vibrio campbellii]|uniref:Uncharacterized protein n=1 Tax=Vibrio campbellii TaxID=680 RepID=A0ABY5I9N1_9VIBR|nr:hypothetical protein [Vibrio campbellii]UTZ30684.1 hypothetical protein HB762_04350 [Vibrio campbellii]UTZ37612.1 hypothetical protein HB763_13485 [Vibrio campbellii]